jgi:hypothetical protein
MLRPKSAIPLIGAIIFLALAALAIYFLATRSAETSPALTKTRSNAAYGFMLKMPADFAAYPPNATPNRDETGAPTGQALLLQNTHGTMVQIVIAPDTRAQPSTNLTVDDIERSAPVLRSLARNAPRDRTRRRRRHLYRCGALRLRQLNRSGVVCLPRQHAGPGGERLAMPCAIGILCRFC